MKGIICEFDKAGRIVIPSVFRKELMNGEDRHVQLTQTEDGILLSRPTLSCQLCGSAHSLFRVGQKTLCGRCIAEIKNY